MACVVLMMIIGAITYGAQLVHKRAELAILSANEAQLAAEAAAAKTESANTSLQVVKHEARELQRFLAAWVPQIQQMGTLQEVEEAIQVNTREKGVFVVSQRFEDKANSGNLMMPRSVLASMVIEDDYSKVMNWFGEIERRLPLARVLSCQISAAATGRQIHMEISFEVPLINLSVNPMGATQKKKA